MMGPEGWCRGPADRPAFRQTSTASRSWCAEPSPDIGTLIRSSITAAPRTTELGRSRHRVCSAARCDRPPRSKSSARQQPGSSPESNPNRGRGPARHRPHCVVASGPTNTAVVLIPQLRVSAGHREQSTRRSRQPPAKLNQDARRRESRGQRNSDTFTAPTSHVESAPR